MPHVNVQHVADQLATRIIFESIRKSGEEGIRSDDLRDALVGMISDSTYCLIVNRGIDLGLVKMHNQVLYEVKS